MKRLFKEIICLLFMFSLFSVSTGVLTYADTSASEQTSDITDQFATMTNEELNEYIDNIKDSYTSESQSSTKLYSTNSTSTSSTDVAWLAAAQILENNGYTCSAELLRDSVNNQNYKEVSLSASGLFSKKIVTTSAFKKYLKKIKAGKSPSGIVFKKGGNADLFYSLHNVDASASSSIDSYLITVTDTYDFDVDSNYEDLLTTCVNNAAWLCQQAGTLSNISVSITFVQ